MSEVELQKFDQYPWDDDKDFQTGLNQLLKSDTEDIEETILKAKAFFYYKKNGIHIDTEEYKQWKNKNKKSYNEIVDLILQGKPVPGIKTIPDTVLGDEASSISKAPQRKKPWEKEEN